MNTKQQQEGEDGYNNEDESFLGKLLRDSKKTIFDFTFHMLNGERIGFYQRIMLIIIETFQILNFQFCYELSSLWKNSKIVDGIRMILKFTSIYHYFEGDATNMYSSYKGLFFALISILLFLLLIFLYVIVSLKRKNTHISVLINILRISTELFITILFLPLLQIYISPLNCSSNVLNGTQTYVLNHFPQVECFGSDQIALVFLGIICTILIILYVGLMNLIFFGCRIQSQDCYTKNSGRGEFCFFIHKLILALFYNFLMNQGYDVAFIVVMLIGSFLLFEHYQFNLTFHDFYISKLITAQHAINLWTTLMLILAKLTENYEFDGTSIIWILGVPFIYIIIMMRSEQRYDILLINTNQYDVLSDPLRQLPYITKLLGRYTKDKHIQIMLDGFLDHHRNTCIQDDCPSRRRLAKTTKFSKALRNEKVSEQLIMIYTVIQSMYYFALQKFPNNTKIRILYALYLVDTMRSSQQALQELLNTESERPVFDEEFIIFRYKQVIENDLMENSTTLDGSKDQQGSSDVVNELSVQNHERLCRANIEKSASLHVEFWSQLSEDHPDLGKLSEIGFKITIANQNADDQWNRLERINTYIPSLMRIYARFLSEIIHDKDGSFNILKKLIDINFKNQNSNKISNFLDLSTDSRPSIVISAEDDSFGLVANINLAAASLSGYNKMEILNRNVSALMPTMYGRYHDQFLESYLATLEPRILNFERILPMKTKQGYILPLIVLVRHVPSLIHGLQFVSSIRINRNLKEVCSLIVNKDGIIENLGPTCVSILKIDCKKITKKEFQITDCIPNYWDQIKAFQEKNGAVVLVQEFTKLKKTFMAKVTAIEILTYGLQGYILRIEKIQESESDLKIDQLSKVKNPQQTLSAFKGQKKSKIKRPVILQHLCIRFDSYTGTYYGENIMGGPLSIKEDDINDTHSNVFSTISAQRYNDKDGFRQTDRYDVIEEQIEKQSQKQFINYGIGIRTVRMVNSQFVDLEELRLKEEEAEEDILEQEQFEEEEQNKNFNKFRNQEDQFQSNQQDSNDSGNVFKKKNSFSKFIEESRFLHSLALDKFRLFVLGFVVLASTFAAVNHILITSQLEEINERVKIYTYSTTFSANGQRIVDNCLTIYMHTQKILVNIDAQKILQQMQDTAAEMKTLNDYIELSSISISDGLNDLLNNQKVTLFDINSSQEQNLKLANQQILAKINNLVGDILLDSYVFDNTDFYFIVYNEMNIYFDFLKKRSNFYVTELDDWSSSKQSQFILYLIFSIVWIIICFIGMLPFYLLVNKSQQQILTLFLDIPVTKVKKLFAKCENFLACLQGSNDDEVSSTNSEIMDEEDQSLTNSNIRRRSKKRRSFRINLKNKQNFFLPFVLIIIIFESYFSYSYVMSRDNAEDIQFFLQELNYTSTFESFYGFSLNSLQLMLLNKNLNVNEGSSETYIDQAIDDMYQLNNNLQKEHSQNKNRHQSQYDSDYNLIFMQDSCQSLSDLTLLSQVDCEQFSDSSLRQGLALGLSNHIENFIQIQNQYQKAKAAIGSDDQKMKANNKLLLQSNESLNIKTMQNIYIKVMMRYLVEQFKYNIQQGYNTSQTIRITILILTIVLIILLYISIWVPIMNNISREIIRIRSMIFMIPLDTIASVKSIKDIFQPFLSQIYTKE